MRGIAPTIVRQPFREDHGPWAAMLAHHFTRRALARRQRSLLAVLAALSCSVFLAACGDNLADTEPVGTEPAASPSAAQTSAPAAIELTDDGFSPDNAQISRGTRVNLHNATDSTQSVVIKGRDFGGSEGKTFTIEPGHTLDLNFQQLGAYVLTLADDPQVTASVLIS